MVVIGQLIGDKCVSLKMNQSFMRIYIYIHSYMHVMRISDNLTRIQCVSRWEVCDQCCWGWTFEALISHTPNDLL